VNNIERHQKLLAVLKKASRERKKQAKQIDILCNDMINAQRDFIKRLKTIDFRANFYESIMGITDLNSLLSTTADILKKDNLQANIVFFLRQGESLEIYNSDDNHLNFPDEQRIENYFSPELISNICISNKICGVEEMFEMGLQGSLTCLNAITASTIPLDSLGSAQGFMLIYRPSEKKFRKEEIDKIYTVSTGLSLAICSCKALMHSSD
jgi:hypothetical protein